VKNTLPLWPAPLALAAGLFTAPWVLGQDTQETAPRVGQPGKDVVWVPTPNELVDRMLQMAKTSPNDLIIDLGSGDGRIAIAAAKRFGARAQGIEYNPDMVALSNKAAAREGVAERVKFVQADIFQSDFSQATVITMYLLPDLNLKLRPKILEMKPGTRVVSHQFDMGDWQPDETASLESRSAYLWIVPADVAGDWELTAASAKGPITYRLQLGQAFQIVNGTARLADKALLLSDGRLQGTEIHFTLLDESETRLEFSGQADGGTMQGTMHSTTTPTAKWSAKRLERRQ